MDRTPTSNSAATGAPSAYPAAPSAGKGDYTALLTRFPQVLQKQIAHDYAGYEQLQAFRHIFVVRDWPLTEQGVSYVMEAERHRRFSELDQHRVAQMDKFFCSGDFGRHDKAGATPLHRAILWGDIGLIRTRLQANSRAPAAILAPRLRNRDCIAMAVAGGKLDGAQGASERNEILLEVLTNRATLPGDAASTFTAHAGDHALTFAITSGANASIVTELIEHCAQHCPELLSTPDQNGNPPLAAAAASGRPDVVCLLLRQGTLVPVDQQNGMGRSALMEAVRLGDRMTMELLLEQGASVALTDAIGHNARQLAALCQQPALYNALTAWEASHDRDANREQAAQAILADVISAVRRGDASVVTGIVTEQKAVLGHSSLRDVLRVAVRVPDNARVIGCLLDEAVTGCKPHELADSALCLAAADVHAMDTLASVILPGDPGQLAPDVRNALLHAAAELGSVKCVCYALDGGADVNGKGADGKTMPLLRAVNRNDHALIVALLKRHARIMDAAPDEAPILAARAKPGEQARALVWCIANGHPDLYRDPAHAPLLTELALELHMPELAGKLVRDGQLEPARFRDKEKSLLLQAVELDRPDLLAALLGAGAPLMQLLHEPNGDQDAALKLAAQLDKPHAFHLVLQACKVSRNDDPDVMLKRLALAAKVGNADSCLLILKQGELRLPRTARRPVNPLLQAVIHGRYEVIALLLQHGADPFARHENRYKSALEKAVSDADPEAVEALLRHAPHGQTELGALLRDLLDTAAENNDHATFEALIVADPNRVPTDSKVLAALLKQAVSLGSVPACRALIGLGAKPDRYGEQGRALLRAALLSSHPDMEIVRLLFDHGLRITGPGNNPDGSDDSMWHPFGFQGRGMQSVVQLLADDGASDDKKIYWAGQLLCANDEVLSGFSSVDDMAARALERALQPLWAGMPDPRMYIGRAINSALPHVLSYPRPAAKFSFLLRTARVLDAALDTQAIVLAIRDTGHLEFLENFDQFS